MFRNRRRNARRSTKVQPSAPPPTNGPRIPALLQAVFLSSNRGNDVHEPPPNRVAHRVFFGRKLRTPWGQKKQTGASFGSIERNESSTSSNDDTIPTTISATSSSASSSKYFQDIVVYPEAAHNSKPTPTEPLKVRVRIFFLTGTYWCESVGNLTHIHYLLYCKIGHTTILRGCHHEIARLLRHQV
jgi:hypothetical protein